MNTTPPNRRRNPLRLFPFCLLGFAIFGLLLPLLASPQLPVIRFVRDPDPAPDFQLKDLAGKDLSLASAHGKVVLLNFWATWCGPCRAEIPSLIELQNRYKERLQIIGLVADDDDPDAVKQVIDSEGINYPVAIANDNIRLAYGGIPALPTLFVINSEGRIVQKHVGLFNPALYETEVRALLDLPIAAKVETFEDTGEIFLKHADRATMLPGVNTDEVDPRAAPRRPAQIQRRRVHLRLQAHSRPVPHHTTPRARSARTAPPPSSKRSFPLAKKTKPRHPPPSPLPPLPNLRSSDKPFRKRFRNPNSTNCR